MILIILFGVMLFFTVLYFVIKAAVEGGTLKALIKYGEIKNPNIEESEIKV